MARTWHHGDRNRAKLFYDPYYPGREWVLKHVPGNPPGKRWVFVENPAWAPRKRKRHARIGFWMRTPGWWNREFMTVPLRAKTRNLIRYQMSHPGEDVIFPLSKKPYVYYW